MNLFWVDPKNELGFIKTVGTPYMGSLSREKLKFQ